MGPSHVVTGLRLDRNRLTDTVVRRVWNVLPGYSEQHLTAAELRHYVESNIGLATEALTTGRPPADGQLADVIELGTSRALQGIPLDSVIQAFRAAERTVLDELLVHVAERGPGDVQGAVGLLADTFDRLTQACITSYRRSAGEIDLHHDHLERDLVGDLAIGEQREEAQIRQHARLLGADAGHPHRAMALLCPYGEGPEAMLRVRRHVMSTLSDVVDGRVLFGAIAGIGLLLVPGGEEDRVILPAVARALDQRTLRDPAVAGIGTVVPELRSVTHSCRQAIAAAEAAHRAGRLRVAVAYRDVLVDVALLQDAGLQEQLAGSRLGPLDGRPQLVETLRAFLASDLCQSTTARALVVHPNTVYHRLGRIADLTGKDPRRFADAVELALALRASELTDPDVRRPAEGPAGVSPALPGAARTRS